MNTVPNMISTKDLSYIADMLNWNIIALKKARHFYNEVNDQEVKTAMENAYKLHEKHYMFLLNLLK